MLLLYAADEKEVHYVCMCSDCGLISLPFVLSANAIMADLLKTVGYYIEHDDGGFTCGFCHDEGKREYFYQ